MGQLSTRHERLLRHLENDEWARLHRSISGDAAFVLLKLGQYQQALALGEEALTVSRRILDPRDVNTITAMHNRALVYTALARYAEAEELEK